MGRIVRLACGAAAVAAAVLVVAWPSAAIAAPTDGGIGLSISSAEPAFPPGEPVRLIFSATNTSSEACGLTDVPDGTVQVLSIRRDGEELTPLLGDSRYEDGIEAAIASGMVSAEPGSTVEAVLVSLHVADGSDARSWVLRSVVATSSGVGLDMVWPVGAPGRYELTARYAVPPVDAAVAPCIGAAAATVTFTVGDVADAGDGVPIWVWLAAAAVLMLGVGALVVVALRRRRHRAAVAAVLLLFGVGTAVGTAAEPARALVIIDPGGGESVPGVDFGDAVATCFGIFAAPGGDPAGIIPRLQDPSSPRVRIVPVSGGSNTFRTPDSPDGPGSSSVTWNPTSTGAYTDGVARDPCASLYHELVHADGIARDDEPEGMCGSTGLRTAEVRATLLENQYRASQGLPPRTEYQGHALPASLDECNEPGRPERPTRGPRQICAGEDSSDCARTSGDPHLVTFDRVFYDFQAVGEFVLVRSTSGESLEVQARQAPFSRGREISINTAVAFRLGDHRMSMSVVDGVTQVRVDGELVTLSRGETPLPGGGTVVRRDSDMGAADGYDIQWPDGSAAAVDHTQVAYRLLVRLDPGRAGEVEGLLGDFDGDPADDLPAMTPSFDDLYPSYADSWRVAPESSLFSYGDGESTETFTDRSYPDRPLTVDGLDATARAQAELACRLAGVTDPWLFAECVFDVGVTGRPEFAVATAGTEFVAAPAGAPIAATPVAEAAIAPGGEDRLTFLGRAGDAVYVDIVAPTLPSRCSPTRLLDPTGAVIASGCMVSGAGIIDRTELEVDGEYTFLIEGYEGATGRAMVRVYSSQDTDGAIVPNGAEVSAVVAQPGSLVHYRFTGSAGQRVYLAASGLPSQCSPLRLLDAAERTIASGCFVNGGGRIDDAVLPTDGTYTVLVDPVAGTIGTVHLRLFVSDDRIGSIAVGGPAVVATIDTPGAVSLSDFTATAGTSVTLAATEATLPGGCSPLRLLDAQGRTLGSGCLLNGEGGIDATLLPVDGTYRILVDPAGAATGSVTLSLVLG